MDSDSDWDYYTDEYYDDDPSIIRQRRTRKKMPVADNQQDRSIDRNHTIDSSKISPGTLVDTDNFQGVLWKSPEFYTKKSNPFKPGDGESVALLKNWREVFELSKPKTSRKSLGGFRDRESQQTNRESARTASTKRAHRTESETSGAESDGLALWDALEKSPGNEVTINIPSETELPPIASSPLPLPPFHLDCKETEKPVGKKGMIAKSSPNGFRTNGSRLKEVTTAEEFSLLDEQPSESSMPSTPEFKVLVPPAPGNSQDYKKLAEVPVNTGANRPGRKRKASSSFEETKGAKRGRPAKKPGPGRPATVKKKLEKQEPALKKAERANAASSKPRAARNSASTRSLRQRR